MTGTVLLALKVFLAIVAGLRAVKASVAPPTSRPVNYDVSLLVLRHGRAILPRAGRRDACGDSDDVRPSGSPLVGVWNRTPARLVLVLLSALVVAVISLHAPTGGAAAV